MGTNAPTDTWPLESDVTVLRKSLVENFEEIELLARQALAACEETSSAPTFKQIGVVASIVRLIRAEEGNINHVAAQLEGCLAEMIDRRVHPVGGDCVMASSTPIDLGAHVEIPTETLIEVAAGLYALEERVRVFNGRQDTPTSSGIGEMAAELLRVVAANKKHPEFVDYWHPLAVEALARSEELVAGADDANDAEEHRAFAARIRESGYALAHLLSDEDLRKERAGR